MDNQVSPQKSNPSIFDQKKKGQKLDDEKMRFSYSGPFRLRTKKAKPSVYTRLVPDDIKRQLKSV